MSLHLNLCASCSILINLGLMALVFSLPLSELGSFFNHPNVGWSFLSLPWKPKWVQWKMKQFWRLNNSCRCMPRVQISIVPHNQSIFPILPICVCLPFSPNSCAARSFCACEIRTKRAGSWKPPVLDFTWCNENAWSYLFHPSSKVEQISAGKSFFAFLRRNLHVPYVIACCLMGELFVAIQRLLLNLYHRQLRCSWATVYHGCSPLQIISRGCIPNSGVAFHWHHQNLPNTSRNPSEPSTTLLDLQIYLGLPQPTPEPLWADTPKSYRGWGKRTKAATKPLWSGHGCLFLSQIIVLQKVRTIRVQFAHLRIPYTYHFSTWFHQQPQQAQQSLNPLTGGTLSPSKVIASKPYLRLTWW